MKHFLTQTAKEVNQNSIEKGFWEEGAIPHEKIMLIVCELSEAVEADRKSKRCNIVEYYNKQKEDNAFENYIKDTVEDELADALIRALDYCHRMKINLDDIRDYELNPIFEKETNFAKSILYLVGILGMVNSGAKEDIILTRFIYFLMWGCKNKWRVDIERHVWLKMQYNKTRPYKHGKKY